MSLVTCWVLKVINRVTWVLGVEVMNTARCWSDITVTLGDSVMITEVLGAEINNQSNILG